MTELILLLVFKVKVLYMFVRVCVKFCFFIFGCALFFLAAWAFLELWRVEATL